MKKNRIIFISLFIPVFICINIAHNASKLSINHLLSLSYAETNDQLTEDYYLPEVESISYYKPIIYWSFIFHSKISVKYKNGHVENFSGESLPNKFPSYARVIFINDEIELYRFGGFHSEDVKAEQLDVGRALIERVLFDSKIKNEINHFTN